MAASSASASPNTRRKSAVWLIGSTEEELKGCKLPSNRQILSVFFHHHKTLKKTIRNSARDVIKEAAVFWEKARIPIRKEDRAISKLESLFNDWAKLKKNAKRMTASQRMNESKFMEILDDLFDIAHMDALKTIKIDEDRDFLVAQRDKGRRGSLGPIDKILTTRECRAQERQSMVLKRKQAEEERQKVSEQTAILESSSSDENDNDYDRLDREREALSIPRTSACIPKKRARRNSVTPELAAALDRVKLSDRKATVLFAATAQSLGYDTKNLNINRSSIRRSRLKCRKEIAQNLKADFATTADKLVVHWDGKILKDITGHEHVDRLPVIVSGASVTQLLGVPKLISGTGESQAAAIEQLLSEWGVADRIAAMCFDTTACNTGYKNGTCVLLEKKLNKELVYLACRHHIMELVLATAFEETMGVSSGPDIAIFKRFQTAWQKFDHTNYETGAMNEQVMNVVKEEMETIITFCETKLTEIHPREDYREFLEIVLIFLGVAPARGVRFRTPGAFHHARWMAKAIYSFKIWMFRGQFRLTAREEKGLRCLCVFVTKIYIKAWFTASLSVSSPNNDLNFLQNLVKFKAHNPSFSKVTSNTFARHLWYLSEELVGLAFFDKNVSVDSKRNMVHALKENMGGINLNPPKRIQLDVEKCVDMKIEQFVTRNTILFFQRLNISTSFFDSDPEDWDANDEYKIGLNVAKNLRVVNDHAERGVALIAEYNSIITKSEDQMQFLLQVVQDHRKRFPDSKKETLTRMTE